MKDKLEYSVREFAKELGVSHDTVSRWIRLGKIKARRGGFIMGKTSPFFISRSELERLKKLQVEQTKYK
ncbi:MAG: helix-turn-helix domain-containing protein [Anaerolineales bacterium]|nr:helix-turn-helix domain-containing protein [Anaerolineales bacterium]NUQ58242.1 helix-turn-helix domain-containing protein [Anaerolineales bacterium]